MAAEALASRYDKIFQRIGALEKSFALLEQDAPRCSVVQSVSDKPPSNGLNGIPTGCTASATQALSENEKKLTDILRSKNFSMFKFVRVPSDYYDQPLEYRMGVLGAPTKEHLCKSMVMVNTKAQVDDCSNWKNSKYYLVILQYTEERTHGEKLKNFLHNLNDGAVSKKSFNVRLAPQEESDQLSGFEHNAVTPIGFLTPMPIILSHKIASLDPGYFFMGAGEVDLKISLRVDEFIEKYKPFVVDCTY